MKWFHLPSRQLIFFFLYSKMEQFYLVAASKKGPHKTENIFFNKYKNIYNLNCDCRDMEDTNLIFAPRPHIGLVRPCSHFFYSRKSIDMLYICRTILWNYYWLPAKSWWNKLQKRNNKKNDKCLKYLISSFFFNVFSLFCFSE